MENILECTNITKSFSIRKKNRKILTNISFTLSRGEIATITGKSGSGKSTLLSILAGLDIPESGNVKLFNMNVSTATEQQLAPLRYEKIGFLFQNHNLIPSWTAFENIEAAIAHKKQSSEHVSKVIHAILKDVGLSGCEHNLPSELSAGEQQRVAVARAIINNPDLIFADEPVADVDPLTGRTILDMLLKRVNTNKTTILLATHGVPPSGFEHNAFELVNGTLHHL